MKSKGLSDKRINSTKTSDYGITSYLSYYDTNKIRVKFDGGCLKQDQGAVLHGGRVNFYIFYDISKNVNISDFPTLENCFLELLSQPKTLISTNMNILVIELDLIDMEVVHFLALN